MTKKNRKSAFTLIELLFFSVGLGCAMAAYDVTHDATHEMAGALIAFPCAVIAFHTPLITCWILQVALDFFFPRQPEKCEDKKCNLWTDGYHVRIGVFHIDHKARSFRLHCECFSEEAIIYYRCQCGYEYVDFGWKLRTKVNEDGTLTPFMRKIKWQGWRKDEREHFDGNFFKIDKDMLILLRTGVQRDVDQIIEITRL